MTFAMKTSGRGILRPFSMMSVRSWPARPDEGEALLVLVGARRLAHEHQLGPGVALAEDDRLPAAGQLAARAVADVLADRLEGSGLSRRRDASRPAERR